MSVNPGFGGQKFIEQTIEKAKALEAVRRERELDFLMEIDGGINLNNVREVTDSGIEVVVAGSSVFGADDIKSRVREFKALYE